MAKHGSNSNKWFRHIQRLTVESMEEQHPPDCEQRSGWHQHIDGMQCPMEESMSLVSSVKERDEDRTLRKA